MQFSKLRLFLVVAIVTVASYVSALPIEESDGDFEERSAVSPLIKRS